jgi:phosphate-selective porin
MLNVPCRTIAAIAVSLFLAGSASAQTTAPVTTQPPKAVTTQAPTAQTPKAPAPKAATDGTKAATGHSAVSLECSKQADAKGLRGKDRKHFRSECKKNGGKSG